MIAAQTVSAVFALAAAVFWFLSLRAKLPKAIETIDFGSGADDLDLLTRGLHKQSQLSAIAAFCAGISALAQFVAIAISIAYGIDA